jgi:hypothetical protein
LICLIPSINCGADIKVAADGVVSVVNFNPSQLPQADNTTVVVDDSLELELEFDSLEDEVLLVDELEEEDDPQF